MGSSAPFTVESKLHEMDMQVKSCRSGVANKFRHQNDDARICVVMVGLPARGKSLIAGKGKRTPYCDTSSGLLI